MKISLFQQDIIWLDPEANYLKIESVLMSHPDTDLLVMPEMCSTGFITNPSAGQIEKAGDVEERLKALAEKYNTALCGSFAVETAECNRNRCYFVTPEGEVHYADKHHLFSPGGEAKGYKAGDKKCIVEWHGIRFLLLVCYDLRFCVWSRLTDEEPYDMMVCVANWPSQRQLAWNTLLPARAIENQAYVLGVNRVGQDNMCPYSGGTVAIHPYGHVVAQCEDNQEGVCSFEPDIEKLKDFRKKFPSQVDADKFVIIPDHAS